METGSVRPGTASPDTIFLCSDYSGRRRSTTEAGAPSHVVSGPPWTSVYSRLPYLSRPRCPYDTTTSGEGHKRRAGIISTPPGYRPQIVHSGEPLDTLPVPGSGRVGVSGEEDVVPRLLDFLEKLLRDLQQCRSCSVVPSTRVRYVLLDVEEMCGRRGEIPTPGHLLTP